MLSKIMQNPPPLIFVDTLYHFPETYDLVEEVKKRYSRDVHVYKPEGCDTVELFEKKYGQKFWEADEVTYDYLVKVRLSVCLHFSPCDRGRSTLLRLSLREGHTRSSA